MGKETENDLEKYVTHYEVFNDKEECKSEVVPQNISTIIELYKKDFNNDIELKNKICNALIFFMGGSMIATYFILILKGAGIIELTDNIVISVLLKEFLEIAGMLLCIVKYLFKDKTEQVSTICDKEKEEDTKIIPAI